MLENKDKSSESQLKLELVYNYSTFGQRRKILNDSIPHIIKYMGSKKPIIDFIVDAINEIHNPDKLICDLFSGSCSISAALRKKYNFISNDVQDYSRILAHTYFSDFSNCNFNEISQQIEFCVHSHILWFKENYGDYFFDFSKITSLEEFALIESKQRNLFINENFQIDFHLFTKYYSGTYWSFEQCIWIDALRKAAESFKNNQIYYAILSSLMYSMSYTTQSTGHFAQYRDGDTIDAMNNILYYRQKNLQKLFKKKLNELLIALDDSLKQLQTTTLDFEECLKIIPDGSTVYADPPYAPVHYSRFYHALETLIKYDYPQIDYKGRYRVDRHQSHFSQKSNALKAFETLFSRIVEKQSQMILSYSGSGVVKMADIIKLANDKFTDSKYNVVLKSLDHKHSTMGRFEDADRDVIEYLIIAKYK